jgi:uncharacterized protein
MLLTALKLKVAALAVVAGIETNDLPKISPEMDKIMKTLATEQDKLQKDTQNPTVGAEWTKVYNEAVRQVQELAGKNDPAACYTLARWGILAGGEKVNMNAVVDLYRKAGDIPAAQIELAQVLLQAFRQDADKAREAVDLIVKAEKSGNKLARRLKAQLHLSGSAAPTVPQSNKDAVELLEAGSKDGDGDASLGLYQIYSRGITGYALDFAKALEYLKLAAETQNNPTALGEYGARLLNGDSGDGKTAPNLVKKSIPDAANRILGTIFENGLGENGKDLAPDVKKAFDYYSAAANGNDAAALMRLAQAAESGVLKNRDAKPDDKGAYKADDVLIQPNPNNSLALYRLAAQNGAAEGFYAVGRFYETGSVVDRDLEKAFQLYVRASIAGVAPAMVQLAGLYANGTGVTQDVIAAGGWYKRAADAPFNNPAAKIAYGMMAEQGAGIERSTIVAERYYDEAATMGAPGAMIRLCALYIAGVDGKPNFPLAWAYAQLASEATKGASQEVNAFVAQIESAKMDDKMVFTDEVKKQGKLELEKLKKKSNVGTAAPAAAAPASTAPASDSKKKSTK